jgi:hypothetical protein
MASSKTKQHVTDRISLVHQGLNYHPRGTQGMFGPASSIAPVKHWIVLAAVLFAAAQFVPFGPQRSAATGPVSEALRSASSSDRAKIASVYAALGDLIKRDSGTLIPTTAVWRAIYADALRLAAGGTDLPGKYPGLDVAVEKVLSQHYALENQAIDKTLAGKIAAGCEAVEKQCE